VGGDEVYGNNQVFCAQLEDLGEKFLMDVAHVTRVWTSDPRPGIVQPRSTPKGGRPRRSVQAGNAQAEQRKLSALVAECFEKESREIKLRGSTQGELRAPVMVRSVWLWDGKTETARARLLVVRKEADGSFKYSLGNLPADTPWERLALMQARRFWIEQAFKEAKGELGMAQYEVRGWGGWHHHMAMVSLAQLFTVKERRRVSKTVPLLSVRDVTELLDLYLPRRERSEKEVLRQMMQRHSNRAQSSKSHAKARKKRQLTPLKT
jgi:SRSO17 transposase